MQAGDAVRVFPHGQPEMAAEGLVILSTEDGTLISFGNRTPSFVRFRTGTPPALGVTMLVYRESVGPWIELMNGGHYEIEEMP